jgi:integrase/recombinase XerD
MTALRRRLRADLPRRDLAPRTQPCDVEAVKHLTHHDRRAPDQISADELRQYCRCLIHDQKVAERTFRMHLDGIRCFSERPRPRPWPVFDRVRPRPIPTRPVGLSLREVRSLLALVEPPTARMGLQRIDACGLRLTEGPQLPVSDLDAPRLRVRVPPGTGGQDRVVPLAPRGLECLRASWPRPRPRPWVCPARDGSAPLPATSLHKTCNAVVRQRGIAQEASSHTRRHS